jgi:hypothetical protein
LTINLKDYFIRQEKLEDTLCEAIEQIQHLTDEDKSVIYKAEKFNYMPARK